MVNYNNKDIIDSVKRVSEFIKKNKKNPLTVRVDKDTLPLSAYLKLPALVDSKNRIDKWRKEHNTTYPNYVAIPANTGFQLGREEYLILWNLITPKTDGDEAYNYFVKVFGKVSTIDEALNKVKEKGYGYYYNDRDSNKQTIDHIKAGTGVNCTDSCQLFWHVAKALGYDVRCIHVMCKGGDGHVRLQFKHSKHTGGNWINRDPACVLSKNGKPINAIWCGDGRLIATNPQWFMNTLNR